MKRPRNLYIAFLTTLVMSWGSAAQATLIGDEVNGELITSFAGTFPVTTATVGPGVEFSRTFVTSADPNPFIELDVDANFFTFTFTNPATDCPGSPDPAVCNFNLGLLGIELNGLDWVDNPSGVIVDIIPTFSTLPVGLLDSVVFGPHNISVAFNNQLIPGFGTVWSASWDIITSHSVPEPTTLTLIGLGLAGIGFARRRKKV